MGKKKRLPEAGIEFRPEAQKRINDHMHGILSEILKELKYHAEEKGQHSGVIILNSYVALVQVIGSLCECHHKCICEYMKSQEKAPSGPVI